MIFIIGDILTEVCVEEKRRECMQLGIRLHDTKDLPLEERIKDVHDLGFKCGH